MPYSEIAKVLAISGLLALVGIVTVTAITQAIFNYCEKVNRGGKP